MSGPMVAAFVMQFRIVGTHQHRAVVGSSTFLCLRRDTASESGLRSLWIASRNNSVLKDECRTLNEAKNLCRQVAAEEALLRSVKS
jgi:hypothetical protein